MKKSVYCVTMYRWGDRESHSYVLGIFSTKTKAEKAAKNEQAYRGGNKYYPECLEVPIDLIDDRNFKTIIDLDYNRDMVKHPSLKF